MRNNQAKQITAIAKQRNLAATVLCYSNEKKTINFTRGKINRKKIHVFRWETHYFINVNYLTKLYIPSHFNKHQNRLFFNI